MGLQHIVLPKLLLDGSCQEPYAAAYEWGQDFCKYHIKSLLSGELIL